MAYVHVQVCVRVCLFFSILAFFFHFFLTEILTIRMVFSCRKLLSVHLFLRCFLKMRRLLYRRASGAAETFVACTQTPTYAHEVSLPWPRQYFQGDDGIHTC